MHRGHMVHTTKHFFVKTKGNHVQVVALFPPPLHVVWPGEKQDEHRQQKFKQKMTRGKKNLTIDGEQ